jgi:hypothetical protein
MDEYRILVRKPVGKCPFGRERRWEENIKMCFREMGI